MAWKYEAINEHDTISLHDCRITHIEKQDDNIVFSFLNGFWIVETNALNPFHKTLRTEDEAKLTLKKANCVKTILDGEDFCWQKFYQEINSGKWEFECIDEIYKDNQCTYDGWIWFNKKPYHKELSLKFSYDDVIYQWNEICENRPW